MSTQAQNELDTLTGGLNWLKNITGTGRAIYDDVKGTGGGSGNPPAPAPAPTAPKAFNWKPWAIGGGVLVLVLVLVKVLFSKKK